MRLNPKLLKPFMVLQVIAGLLAIIMALGYLRGEFPNWLSFGVPAIVFIVLYVCTAMIRKDIEEENERRKEEEKKREQERLLKEQQEKE